MDEIVNSNSLELSPSEVDETGKGHAAVERILRHVLALIALRLATGADRALRLSEAATIRLDAPTTTHLPAAWTSFPAIIFSTLQDSHEVTGCSENVTKLQRAENLGYDSIERAVDESGSYWLRTTNLPGETKTLIAS